MLVDPSPGRRVRAEHLFGGPARRAPSSSPAGPFSSRTGPRLPRRCRPASFGSMSRASLRGGPAGGPCAHRWQRAIGLPDRRGATRGGPRGGSWPAGKRPGFLVESAAATLSGGGWKPASSTPASSALPTPAARLAANVLTTGHAGGHDLHLRTLRQSGVTLTGRFLGATGHEARFAADLAESVAWGDERYRLFVSMVRDLVRERGLEEPDLPRADAFRGRGA